MRSNKHIILFDGECNFCSFWVNYVLKKDKKDVFRFATLQSAVGKEYLSNNNVDSKIDSVVLIENDTVYIKSTAALRILKTLRGLRSVFYGFIIIPAFGRDLFYDIVAKYRYHWFGKNDCEFVPLHNFKNKFLM